MPVTISYPETLRAYKKKPRGVSRLMSFWVRNILSPIQETVNKIFREIHGSVTFIQNYIKIDLVADKLIGQTLQYKGQASQHVNCNKEFCVLHVQSNTTIFYLVVQ